MTTRRIRASRAWLLLFGLLAGGLALAEIAEDAVAEDAAWVPRPALPVEQSGPTVALDPVALEAFVEGFVTGRMKAHHAAGVTVSVVHDGRLVLARGFGHADRAAGRPVAADATLFRPGSISKTFTWTAVMQLVEQGRLDLDADIQGYLPALDIPRTFPAPITLAHLMAHTPGFEESVLGHLFTDHPDRVRPLLDYLQIYQPARVRPPGVRPAYSNYGSGLAGLIVANVSGLPWEDYADRHLFEPLGMVSSTFREPWGAQRTEAPMPAALADRVSRGYQWRAGAFVPGGFEYIGQIGPAGALSTTAVDMARWMLVHLGEGELDGVRILGQDTARLIYRQHYTPDAAVPGIAHGFIESRIGGYRAIGHGGGTVHFISDMQLIPALGLGVFVSTNTSGTGGLVVQGFVDSLVERFFPQATPAAAAGADVAAGAHGTEDPETVARRARLAEFTGAYLPTRRAYTTVERALNTPVVGIQVTADGALLMASPMGPVRFREEAPDTFRSEETGQLARFVRNEAGGIDYLSAGVPILVMEPVGALGNPRNLFLLLGAAGLVLACVPVGAWLRRRRAPPQTGLERAAGALVVVTALVWLAGYCAAFLGLAPLLEDFANVFYTFPSMAFRVALGIGLAGAVLTVLCCLLLYPVWRTASWPFWRRVRHTAVVAAALVTLLVLYDLNAIGFRFIA